MPLINQNRRNGFEDITMKKVRNFNKFHLNTPTIATTNIPYVEGEGLFSGLSNLISSGVNFVKTNSEVIKTVGSAGANTASAAKYITDAVNSTKKLNAEIDQLKRIKEYRSKKETEKEKIKEKIKEREKEPTITFTPENNKMSIQKTSTLNQQQKNAIENISKNLSKKKLGKGNGLRIY